MAFFPIIRSAPIVLIAVLAAAAAFLPAIVNSATVPPAFAQPQSRDLPGRFVASGTVASIQSERGEPSWVASGTWRMIVEQAADASVRSASFRSTFNMVHLDGTVPHKHTISDLKLASWVADNSTMTFDGTFTMTLAGEPRREVPVQIIIRNGNAISIEIDSRVTTHFGDTPIYGIVTRMRGSMMMDDHIHGTTPRAAESMQLAGLSRSTVNYYGNASGYLVHPEKGGRLAAVVMIHEWWGLNQNIKNIAETLAREGYACWP